MPSPPDGHSKYPSLYGNRATRGLFERKHDALVLPSLLHVVGGVQRVAAAVTSC